MLVTKVDGSKPDAADVAMGPGAGAWAGPSWARASPTPDTATAATRTLATADRMVEAIVFEKRETGAANGTISCFDPDASISLHSSAISPPVFMLNPVNAPFPGSCKMASTMGSAASKVLIAAVAVSSIGVALAHEGHVHAPAPAPMGTSAASVLLPAASVVTSLMVAITGFVAAKWL
ncbi:hypothetical protein AXG93_531s1080 [Marchantia polymorpha subsp. ruderalis]|uniref:Uncharacterized protein n=1 Tax=Marchantia polymorpha subsp. ruderalis TaxID=1480154 RepID=A0A176VRZ3_MARPO|nr:hypothetical protein AXG93_531s1080 [Marchantia polymorpha subsp. ruderalis]